MKASVLFAFLFLITFFAKAQAGTNLLQELMQAKPEQFGAILAHPDDYRLQIIYTQINRDKNNIPHFKEFTYHLNSKQYFLTKTKIVF